MIDDFIRRSDAIKAVKAYLDLCCLTEAQFHKEAKDYNEEIARDILDQITPSIDIEPKRGEWIRHENPRYSYDREQGDINAGVYYTCSECNHISWKYNYCPNCGARMKGTVALEKR